MPRHDWRWFQRDSKKSWTVTGWYAPNEKHVGINTGLG